MNRTSHPGIKIIAFWGLKRYITVNLAPGQSSAMAAEFI